LIEDNKVPNGSLCIAAMRLPYGGGRFRAILEAIFIAVKLKIRIWRQTELKQIGPE
jgi:hypothetical protein